MTKYIVPAFLLLYLVWSGVVIGQGYVVLGIFFVALGTLNIVFYSRDLMVVINEHIKKSVQEALDEKESDSV